MASSSTLTPAKLMQLRHERPRTQRVLPLVFAGWLALLIFGPLAFGAVEPWSTLAQQGVAAALAALLLWHWLEDESISFHPNPLYAPWTALAAVVALQITLRVPAYMGATAAAALQALAYLLIFFVGNECLKDPARVQVAA